MAKKLDDKKQSAFIHENHRRPMTRRDLLARGFLSGCAYYTAPSLLSFLSSRAYGACSETEASAVGKAAELPFIMLDLAGGGNLSGSNFLVGGRGGQLDFLPAGAYRSLGLPANQEPRAAGINADETFGIAMHPNSAFLFGMMSVTSPETRASTDGFIICGRTNDDTMNNPLNPSYWIQKAGGTGTLVDVIGNENTNSGGYSAPPLGSYDPTSRSTVIDSNIAATNIVSAPALETILPLQAKRIMAATRAMSESSLAAFNAKAVPDQVKELLRCGYLKSEAKIARVDSAALNPAGDPVLNAILESTVTTFAPPNLAARDFAGFAADSNARMGSIAKLVIEGYAGTGSCVLGGYDYHGNPRSVQERQDFSAGRAIGIALEYAQKKNKDLALYIYTDGGVACSDASVPEESAAAGGKLNYLLDSGAHSSAIMLVHKAGNKGRPALAKADQRQMGHYNEGGAVGDDPSLFTTASPGAIAKVVLLNYLALLGRESEADGIIGEETFKKDLAKYIMFDKLKG